MFGTDGVRGTANAELTADMALRLGAAAADVLTQEEPSLSQDVPRPLAVVGRDPRVSGYMLEAALTAGLTSRGVDVIHVGELPTPAVAHLTAIHGASLGAMISASHNPMPDNGIKFFASGGHKLSDDVEDRIEAVVHHGLPPGPTGAGIGRIVDLEPATAFRIYSEHLLRAAPAVLEGLTVVVDCANGSASSVAPFVYEAAGARVITLCAEPDGYNINEGCGSTHLDIVRAAVVEHGADIGLAHDGDADRCLAVDAEGNDIDGDQIMAVLAIAMKETGELNDNTLVTTVMSNLGLHIAMRENGITVNTTGVGDRYVLAELSAGGYSLGGEQSGHLVLPSHATTGDGILTGLRLMARMTQTGASLGELASVMHILPQVLLNVPVRDKNRGVNDGSVQNAVLEVQNRLGDRGRVLLRPSGTEQLVRVMVEAVDRESAETEARYLAAEVASV